MPKFHECKIHRLHPTQITVGLIEVSDKCINLASLQKRDRLTFLSEHSFPAVLGPKNRLYLTEHHHLALAAWHMKVERAFFVVEALPDVYSISCWSNPYDLKLSTKGTGERIGFSRRAAISHSSWNYLPRSIPQKNRCSLVSGVLNGN